MSWGLITQGGAFGSALGCYASALQAGERKPTSDLFAMLSKRVQIFSGYL